MKLGIRSRGASAGHCPYCRDRLESGPPTVTCRGCQTVLHADCRNEVRQRCPTIGCTGHWTDRPTPPAARAPSSYLVPRERSHDLRATLRSVAAVLVVALPLAGWLGHDAWIMNRAAAGDSSPAHIETLVGRLVGHPRDRAVARVGLITLPPSAVPQLLEGLTGVMLPEREAVLILSNKVSSEVGRALLLGALRPPHPRRVRRLARAVLEANQAQLEPAERRAMNSVAE